MIACTVDHGQQLAIHAVFSGNNDNKTQNKRISQKPLPENKAVLMKPTQNLTSNTNITMIMIKQQPTSSNNKMKLRKKVIFRNAFFPLSPKNDTKKRVKKLSQAKNSLEVYKLRQNGKNRISKLKDESKRIVPLNCKKIKCPSVEQPVCAKLVFTNTSRRNNKAFHVIMINKCEINYVKCHRGLEATIVPMKNCHATFTNNKTLTTNSKITKTGKRRSKREVLPGLPEKTSITPNKTDVKPQTADLKTQKTNLKLQKTDLKLLNKTNVEPIKTTKLLKSNNETSQTLNIKSLKSSNKTNVKYKNYLKSLNKTSHKPYTKYNHKSPNKTSLKSKNEINLKSLNKTSVKTYKKNNLKSLNKTSLKSYTKYNHKSPNKTPLKSKNEINLQSLNKTSVKSYKKTYLKSLNKTSHKSYTKYNHKSPNKTPLKSKNEINLQSLNKTSVKSYKKTYLKSLNKAKFKSKNKINIKLLNKSSVRSNDKVNLKPQNKTSFKSNKTLNTKSLNDSIPKSNNKTKDKSLNKTILKYSNILKQNSKPVKANFKSQEKNIIPNNHKEASLKKSVAKMAKNSVETQKKHPAIIKLGGRTNGDIVGEIEMDTKELAGVEGNNGETKLNEEIDVQKLAGEKPDQDLHKILHGDTLFDKPMFTHNVFGNNQKVVGKEPHIESTAENVNNDEPQIEGAVEIDTDDANVHPDDNVGLADPVPAPENEPTIEGAIEIDTDDANAHPTENVDLAEPVPQQDNDLNLEDTNQQLNEKTELAEPETEDENQQQLEGEIEIDDKDENTSAEKLEGSVEIDDSDEKTSAEKLDGAEATDAEDVAKNEVGQDKQALDLGATTQAATNSPEDTGNHHDDNADTSEFADPIAPDYKYEPNPAPIVAMSVESTGKTDEALEEPDTEAPDTEVLDTEAPDTEAPDTEAPDTEEPGDDIATDYDDDAAYKSLNTDSKANKEHSNDEPVNEEQYQSECPTVCPAKNVMVCAMCDHGIYKTFPSVCHLRMFQCKHKDEKLYLMTRHPCIMSAPYLVDAPPSELQGRLEEPDDFDVVLRFIRCREKGKLETDPRCTMKGENNQDQATKPDENPSSEY